MVFAFAGDSTTTSVLPFARVDVSLAADFLLAVLLLAFVAMSPSGAAIDAGAPKKVQTRTRPSGIPDGLSAEEVFPRPLYAHPLELQIRQPAQGFRCRDLRPVGEVVYMSRGTFVQQPPQFEALFTHHLLVRLAGGRRRRRLSLGKSRVDITLRVILRPPQ